MFPKKKQKTSMFAFNSILLERTAMRYLLVVVLLALAVPAFAEYFVIRDYDVVVRFEKDGTLQFTETIDVEFVSERHGIFRAIPLVNRIQGRRKKLIINDVEVDGWPFSKGYEDNNLMLKIGDPDRFVNGKQRYVIRYRVANGLNFFDDHTEFYWDILGISWDVLVERFRFDLQFPPDLPLTQQDVRVFTGSAGSSGTDATFQLQPSAGALSIIGHTTRLFEPHEAVTIAVRLPKDAFPPPDEIKNWFLLHGLLLLPGILVLMALVLLFYSRNRRQAIMVEYQPPLDILPVVAGGFIDHQVDNRDILSLLPVLAEKGYLRLQIREEEYLWFMKREITTFIRLKEADDALSGFERQFLWGLFESGIEVDLEDLRNRFYKHMGKIRDQVKDWIDDQRWYEPSRRLYRRLMIGGMVLCIVSGFWSLSRDNLDGFFNLAAAGLLFGFYFLFNQRNPAGDMVYRKLEGFRQFMKKVERPVLERLLKEDPHYFDKTLPYAVAFGLVQEWTSLFDGLLTQPPSWYRMHNQSMTAHHFNWSGFSSHFTEEMNSIGSVFGSSPSSSGSGGGSSGGGSGGGGGGSW